jgi:hypothetical protein
MPPRGYRDSFKASLRCDFEKDMLRDCLEAGDAEGAQYYRKKIADRAESAARSKAAWGREPHLHQLVKMSRVRDQLAIAAWDAAGIIAGELGGDARVRHANRKTLYRKFQKAPGLYRRLASASEDPQAAAMREIDDEMRVWIFKNAAAALRANRELSAEMRAWLATDKTRAWLAKVAAGEITIQ